MDQTPAMKQIVQIRGHTQPTPMLLCNSIRCAVYVIIMKRKKFRNLCIVMPPIQRHHRVVHSAATQADTVPNDSVGPQREDQGSERLQLKQ